MMSVYSDQPAYLYAAAEMYYFSNLHVDKSYMYELMCQQYSPSVHETVNCLYSQ